MHAPRAIRATQRGFEMGKGWINAHTHTHTHTHSPTRPPIHPPTHTHTHTHTNTHTNIRTTHTHARTRTHTHTNTHLLQQQAHVSAPSTGAMNTARPGKHQERANSPAMVRPSAAITPPTAAPTILRTPLCMGERARVYKVECMDSRVGCVGGKMFVCALMCFRVVYVFWR